ncbi:MAG: hypothetical protein LBL87_00610 [Ruminococcus sp.]|jgi:hypothetical protein|nr:hypothetical protein [Ruminococcus sp.]
MEVKLHPKADKFHNETIIETDITEEEHAIIEASRELYRTNPESFVSLSD